MVGETVLSTWLQPTSHCTALDGSVAIGNTLQMDSDYMHCTALTHTKAVRKDMRYGFARFPYTALIKQVWA